MGRGVATRGCSSLIVTAIADNLVSGEQLQWDRGANASISCQPISSTAFSCLGALESHLRWVSAVAFSPDGQLLASASPILWGSTVHSTHHSLAEDAMYLWFEGVIELCTRFSRRVETACAVQLQAYHARCQKA